MFPESKRNIQSSCIANFPFSPCHHIKKKKKERRKKKQEQKKENQKKIKFHVVKGELKEAGKS